MSRKFHAADIERSLEWMFGWVDSWVEVGTPGLTFKMWIPEITFKFIGLDRKKRPVSFVICSPKSDPRAVSRNLQKAEEAQAHIGAARRRDPYAISGWGAGRSDLRELSVLLFAGAGERFADRAVHSASCVNAEDPGVAAAHGSGDPG